MFKKNMFGGKEKEVIVMQTIKHLIDDVQALQGEVGQLKDAIEINAKEHKTMVSEMKRRDIAFMEYLKVELTTVKTAETDKFGKDFVKSTYKLIKK